MSPECVSICSRVPCVFLGVVSSTANSPMVTSLMVVQLTLYFDYLLDISQEPRAIMAIAPVQVIVIFAVQGERE